MSQEDSKTAAPSATPEAEWGMTPEILSQIESGFTVEDTSVELGVPLAGKVTYPSIRVRLPLATLNRHGLITGATGTGKTRTLQLLAEGLASHSVPVLLTDVKGDLTGMAEPGTASEKLQARLETIGQEFSPSGFNLELLHLAGTESKNPGSVPVRAAVSDFGPLLMAKVLGLNETQEQALQLIYTWADERGLALIDLKDLREVIYYLTNDGKPELAKIGGVSTATAGVILRSVSVLDSQGGDQFFGIPSFDTADLLRLGRDGRAVISNLNIACIDTQPALVSAFMMWLLADLFDSLPEVGDTGTPKLVVFLDEAHILFEHASKAFVDQVIRTVKLIRSKGVGIVFVTQEPSDIPDSVAAQLGARIMHAQRAYTPAQAKTLEQTVQTLPAKGLDLAQALTNLGTGEALVTVLSAKGVPTPATPTRLFAPVSVMGEASEDTLASLGTDSPLLARYQQAVDPYSAFEAISEGKLTPAEEVSDAPKPKAQSDSEAQRKRDRELEESILGDSIPPSPYSDASTRSQPQRSSKPKGRNEADSGSELTEVFGSMLNSAMRSFGTQLGRELSRTVFGTRRRRRR
ncbi:MAG: DUF853 family protein [Actinomycetaceae bacterium]|nr:DUF853 family protein [Actinomycetaceae bacterium]